MFEIITAKKPQEANDLTSVVKQTTLVLATVLLASLLTACGGGGSSDNSGTGTAQTDTDGDGVIDSQDAFPNDASESKDTDGDGVGDNSDKFPNDASESKDTDGDGTGNTADTDDDNDGASDADEIAAGTDPLDAKSKPSTATVVNGYTLLGADGGNVASDATCVQSKSTGLIWQAKMNKDADGKIKAYSPGPAGTSGMIRDAASVAITDFGGKCGSSKWRLPTVAEVKATMLRDEAGNPTKGTEGFNYDAAVFADLKTLDSATWIPPYCTSDLTVGVLTTTATAGYETATLTAVDACFVRLVSDK